MSGEGRRDTRTVASTLPVHTIGENIDGETIEKQGLLMNADVEW